MDTCDLWIDNALYPWAFGKVRRSRVFQPEGVVVRQ